MNEVFMVQGVVTRREMEIIHSVFQWNEIIKNILVNDEKVNLDEGINFPVSNHSVYRSKRALLNGAWPFDFEGYLHEDNFISYLAQYPEISIPRINGIMGTLRPLQRANAKLQRIIAFYLTAFYELKYSYLPESLVWVVFNYLPTDVINENNKALLNRIHFEITLKDHPVAVSIYSLLKQVLLGNQKYKGKEDEASLVLSYLANSPSVAHAAAKNFQIIKALTTPGSVHNIESDQLTKSVTFFGNKKVKNIKLEKNKDKLIQKIEPCESNLKKTINDYKQCLRLIMQGYGNLSKKTSLVSVRKFFKKQHLQTQTKLFGYRCRDMKHDGNCFFHSIADQLALQSLTVISASHVELRAKALDFMLNHLEDYQDFLDQHEGDINDFIRTNIQVGTWADHLVISALSRALNVTIAIIRSDGASPNIFKRSHPIATLYLGYEIGQHYQSLIETSLPKIQFLKPYIDAADDEFTQRNNENSLYQIK